MTSREKSKDEPRTAAFNAWASVGIDVAAQLQKSGGEVLTQQSGEPVRKPPKSSTKPKPPRTKTDKRNSMHSRDADSESS